MTVRNCVSFYNYDRSIFYHFYRYPTDLVVCCALGVDMFDCVYPTRTAVGLIVTLIYFLFISFRGLVGH